MRCCERGGLIYQGRRKRPTSNAQRRTLNADANTDFLRQGSQERVYNASRSGLHSPIKRKISDIRRRRLRIQFGNGRVAETADQNYSKGKKPQDNLEDRLLDFAAQIVQLVDSLPNTKAGNHIAGQLLRCGTSPLSNHGEVEAAESRKDFLHKLRICLKELRETKRWLRLVGRVNLTQDARLSGCLNEVEELIRIFVASIRTTEKNAK
jgi:four helix bundle protein